MFAPELLNGRRALITGGGTGLGRAIARRYLQLGARIAICGRRLAVLEETAAALRAEIPGADIAVYACDIRDAAAMEAMLDTVFAEGAPSESFHPGEIGWGALAEESRAEILALFPELEQGAFDAYGTSARRTLKAHEAKTAMGFLF